MEAASEWRRLPKRREDERGVIISQITDHLLTDHYGAGLSERDNSA